MAAFRCPLCHSVLSEKHYRKVLGIEREREKVLGSLKGQAEALKRAVSSERAELKRQKAALSKEVSRRVAAKVAKAEDAGRARAEADYRRQIRSLSLVNNRQEELIKKLQEGSRPQERGLWKEEDLERELRRAFPSDLVSRVGRGVKGADVIHQVRAGRQHCGTIVYECKAVKSWQNAFLKQIRKAAAENDARFSVLVTSAFPRNESGFSVKGSCLLVSHSGAVHLANILRQALVSIEEQRLSAGERQEAAQALMAFVAGPEFKGYIQRIIEMVGDMNLLLKKEKDSHQKWWQERTAAYASVTEEASAASQKVRTIVERARNLRVIEGHGKGRRAASSA
ncbi:MAG: DUF2130 domain-containing protein [Myxococcales bacterium]|nr:DUF2130 domain-containing protein [Myxococcales bacterium]